jgi:peptidyl-tRNA hydrolase, PTH1 family
MKIIVGLGNIGEKYHNTRHNAGFIVLDEIIHQLKIDPDWEEKTKLKAGIIQIEHNDGKLLLVKPTTLMNLSGEAISQILSFYKETPENLTVIYDDIDLPLGKIRIRDKGSAGTHNGMKSVIQHLGTDEFKRIRIGIESRGETAPEHQDLVSFVLMPFTEKEKEIIGKTIKKLVKEFLA